MGDLNSQNRISGFVKVVEATVVKAELCRKPFAIFTFGVDNRIKAPGPPTNRGTPVSVLVKIVNVGKAHLITAIRSLDQSVAMDGEIVTLEALLHSMATAWPLGADNTTDSLSDDAGS